VVCCSVSDKDAVEPWSQRFFTDCPSKILLHLRVFQLIAASTRRAARKPCLLPSFPYRKERERSTETYPSSLSAVAALSIGVVSRLAGKSSLPKAQSCTFAPRDKNTKIHHDLFT